MIAVQITPIVASVMILVWIRPKSVGVILAAALVGRVVDGSVG
jgi:hypothetical protein